MQTTFRRALADCDVNGFPLRRRDNIVLLLGAANRDPEVFTDPDRLDVGRGASAHLSFGHGIHHCLGASLARLDGRIVLEMLLERFSTIGLLADTARFRTGIVFRGLHGPCAARRRNATTARSKPCRFKERGPFSPCSRNWPCGQTYR